MQQALVTAAVRLLAVYVSTSWVFHNVSLAAGHHHPDIWHEGDAIPDTMDWGIFQLTAVGDRPDVDGNMYLSAISYGQHALHHLFPTVDQSKLQLLVPVFEQTCKEFFVVRRSGATDGSFDPKKIEETEVCLQHRNISIPDGWLGMVRQVQRALFFFSSSSSCL